jgi:hypothetical protein
LRHLRLVLSRWGVMIALLSVVAVVACDQTTCPNPLAEVTVRIYLFRQAWEDCARGCIYSRYWYFECASDSCELVGSWDAAAGEEQPVWWTEASTSKDCLRTAGECTVSSSDTCSDVSLTPRQDIEAEEAALWLSGSLVAPDKLYMTILADLSSIRAKYGSLIPELNGLRFRPPWIPGVLVVKLSDQAIRQFLDGEYHDLDSLNSHFGLSATNRVLSNWVSLEFTGRFNPYRLVQVYEAVPSVLMAQPDYYYGDFPNVYPWLRTTQQ